MTSDARQHTHSMEQEEEAEDQYESTSQASGNEPKVEEQQAAGAPVEKIDSRHSANSISTVPNGGLTAWLQVLGAWCLFFNSWSVQ